MMKDGKNLGMVPGSVIFSQEIFDTICDRIAGGESLRRICEDDDMPSHRSVTRWLDKDRDGDGKLNAQYGKAREAQADKLFDECLEIADQYDQAAEKLEGGTDHVSRARLRIDTRKWMAGKLRPKVYGDKVAVGGADDLPPIKTEDSGAALLAAFLGDIAERSGTSGDPSE